MAVRLYPWSYWIDFSGHMYSYNVDTDIRVTHFIQPIHTLHVQDETMFALAQDGTLYVKGDIGLWDVPLLEVIRLTVEELNNKYGPNLRSEARGEISNTGFLSNF